MPPKTRIKKEDIIATALEIVRESGSEAINAREIAKRLNCSTQPIFSNYETMESLQEDVIIEAKAKYEKAIEEGMKNPNYPLYKASGISYIFFAKNEKELFKLLFMRNRSGEQITENRDEVANLIEIISKNTGMSEDDSYLFHLEMWIFVHGIATMEATSYLNWNEEMISKVISDAYQGLLLRFQSKIETK